MASGVPTLISSLVLWALDDVSEWAPVPVLRIWCHQPDARSLSLPTKSHRGACLVLSGLVQCLVSPRSDRFPKPRQGDTACVPPDTANPGGKVLRI